VSPGRSAPPPQAAPLTTPSAPTIPAANNLGLLYQQRGNLSEAHTQFQRAIALEPTYVKAHNNLGVLHLAEGRLEQAAAEFRVALTIDARNLESLVNLGLVQRASGRRAEARELLLRAVAIDPRHPGSRYNLAIAADDAGDIAMAIEHYRAFLRYGTVSYPELAARVRARLTALTSS
jgi:Flp pilus assembly protein TadD